MDHKYFRGIHASLSTTQLYTRVTINELRAMHANFHPREQSDRSD